MVAITNKADITTVKEVKLLSFSQLHQAYLLKGKLEAHGLYCYLTNEYTEQTAPHYAMMGLWMDLMIREEDLPLALEILTDGDERKLLELEGWVVCPKCNSTHLTEEVSWGKAMAWLMALVSIIWLGNGHKKYECNDCGHHFTR